MHGKFDKYGCATGAHGQGKVGALVAGEASCVDCPRGSYSSLVGATSCTTCPSHSEALPGSIKCVCSVGYVAESDAFGYSEPTPSVVCKACDAGKYKNTIGNTGCTSCAAAKYSNQSGASSSATCLSCPRYSRSPVGSILISNCSCSAGMFGPRLVLCAVVVRAECVRAFSVL